MKAIDMPLPRRIPWPHRLRHQVLAMVVLIMGATMALLYAISTQRMADAAQDSSRHWAESVARTAASAGSTALALADHGLLEATLRDIASLPGVLRIDTLDARGEPLLSLRLQPDGRWLARWRARDDLGTPAARGPRTVALDGVQALQAWAPAGQRGNLGTVGVTFALDGERAHIDRLRYDAIMAIAFAGLITTLGVYGLVARALDPLQRVVRFSRALADRSGEQLEGRAGSAEVAELSDALNDASRRLREQLDAIRANEDRTRAIVHAVPDAIIGFGPDGLIGIVSPAVASIFGREPDELVGLPVSELLPGLDGTDAEGRTLQGLYMRASQSHVARFETVARRHGGTAFPVEVSLSRTESPSGVRYVCVARDVTEKHMADELLHLYSRALECTSNGIVISDMSLPGSPVFYANAAFGNITGYEPGEAIGRNCDFLQRGDTEQPEIETLRHAVRHGTASRVVLRNYRKDGTLFFNELSISPVTAVDGRIRHYVGVLNDVTERERTRMAIAERSARLNAVFDLSPDGFIVFDRERRLVFNNRVFSKMTGWDDASLQGLTLAEFDDRLRSLRDTAHAYPPLSMQSDDDGGATEIVDLLHLALPRPRVLTRLVRHNAGGQGESILYFRDVTHETEVDRMKSEFLTTAAHELRTPMVSVFGFTELLLNRPVPEGKRRDVLQTIHRQASLLINMVNELLDLARIEARQGKDLKFERIALGGLMAAAIDGLHVNDRQHRVLQRVAHESMELTADPEKFHRALTNVLSNAFKYSPGGGDVTIDSLLGVVGGRRAVGVRIGDQGIGMTPEQVSRVFERFYRADPSGNIPGTGLGMSLVKEIVELHGGRIDLDSAPGRGTQVTLWWPLAEPALEHEA
jgi:PAS domain S-box-containing protein